MRQKVIRVQTFGLLMLFLLSAPAVHANGMWYCVPYAEPTEVTLTAIAGEGQSTSAPLHMGVGTNVGCTPSISTDASWLRGLPASISGGTDINIWAETTGMAVGTYIGHITLHGFWMFEERIATVTVTLDVVPRTSLATIGLFDPAKFIFYLRNSNTTGIADTTFQYGPVGSNWFPLMGDWNGDGIDTPGVYDPISSVFYLRNSNSPGPVDAAYFVYGFPRSKWIPLVGDWDGDGRDSVGFYDRARATFHLRNSLTAGIDDITFTYGLRNNNWISIVGDWNGDGIDTIGLYQRSTGSFFLRNSNTTGIADIFLYYGPAGKNWKPVSGDWDGDGIDTIGLYDSYSAVFYLRNSNTTGIADITFYYGPSRNNWTPLAGTWTRVIYDSRQDNFGDWQTNHPARFYWDTAVGAYHYAITDGAEDYAYRSISNHGGSFQLEFDWQPIRSDHGCNHRFGLWEPSMTTNYPKGVITQYTKDEWGTHMYLEVKPTEGTVSDSWPFTTDYSHNTWYYNFVTFDAQAKSLNLLVTGISDGAVILNHTVYGPLRFTEPNRLALSSLDDWGYPGSTAEGYLKNVRLSIR